MVQLNPSSASAEMLLHKAGDISPAPEETSFDVSAAVSAFINDPGLATLELPASLTPDQRKQAKKLADQHPGLKCESFGFGAERQLHLFKTRTPATGSLTQEARTAVRVKNTFIDDFVAAETSKGAEPIHCRSLPNRLYDAQAWEGVDEEGTPDQYMPIPGNQHSPLPNRSCASSSAVSESPELPELPSSFKYTVRDTFIHIEAEPIAEAERVTQSMPSGVYQKQVEAELEMRRAAAAGHTAVAKVTETERVLKDMPREPAPAISEVLAPGTEVTIEGLVKMPVFNGLTGTVDSLDPETGRYNVLLDTPAAATSPGGSRWAKVKGENLRPRMPPPPFHPPSVAVDECGGCGFEVPPTPKWENAYQAPSAPVKLDALV